MTWEPITKNEFYTKLTLLVCEYGERAMKPVIKGEVYTYKVNNKGVLKSYTEKDSGGRTADVFMEMK